MVHEQQPGEYFDFPAIEAKIAADPRIRVVHIQRSCGYQWRPSIPVAKIGEAISRIRGQFPGRELIFSVDNCYGEFVEDWEPTHVGADLVAGSLIKVGGWKKGWGWGAYIGTDRRTNLLSLLRIQKRDKSFSG